MIASTSIGILPSQGAVALFVARAQAADPHFLPDRRTEGRDCGCSDRTADSRSGSSRMTQGVVDLARYWNFESVSLQRRVSNELLEGGVTSEPARPRVKATRGQNRRTKTRCAIAALAS